MIARSRASVRDQARVHRNDTDKTETALRNRSLIDPFPAPFTIVVRRNLHPRMWILARGAHQRRAFSSDDPTPDRSSREPKTGAAAALVASTFPAVFTRTRCGNRSRWLHPVHSLCRPLGNDTPQKRSTPFRKHSSAHGRWTRAPWRARYKHMGVPISRVFPLVSFLSLRNDRRDRAEAATDRGAIAAVAEEPRVRYN